MLYLMTPILPSAIPIEPDYDPKGRLMRLITRFVGRASQHHAGRVCNPSIVLTTTTCM